MSNHLRHCPKHRKPLPCPHCVLAAKPAPVAVMEPDPAQAPKRRGRPPKFGVAMTQAERKAASRAWQKEKEQDQERRKLVAEILKITRRELSWAGEDVTEVTETHINATNRKYLRHLDETLIHSTIEQLQKVLEAKKSLVDSHGRLHNERSGEAERAMGQSEIERILAAQQHDTSLFDVEDDEAATEEAKQMAAGFQVRPEGPGPELYDRPDSTIDEADVQHGAAPKPIWEPTGHEKWLKKAIWSITNKLKLTFDSEPAHCPFCNELLLIRDSAINHLEEQFETDMRKYRKWWDMVGAFQELQLPGGLRVSSPNVPELPHLHGIREEIDLLKRKKLS